jgi:hypothetical protein
MMSNPAHKRRIFFIVASTKKPSEKKQGTGETSALIFA